jgi:thermopsin
MHSKSLVLIVALIMVMLALSPVMNMNLGGSSTAVNHVTASLNPTTKVTPNFEAKNIRSAYYNETAVLAEIKDKGINSNYAYLPNMNYRLPVKNGLVQPGYSSYPAPMGLGDFGLNNTNGALSAYNLTTSSISGSLSLNSANAFYAGNPYSPHSFSAQLNAVLNKVTVKGISSYVFWTQNVMFYSSRTHQLMFIDNVWNFTSPAMPSSTIYSGNGLANDAFPTFYYDIGPTFTVNYPFTVSLYLNSTLAGGRSALFFNYSIESSTGDHSGSYDEVVFNSTYGMPSGYSAPAPHYLISGNTLTPIGLLNDAEFILGGPGGGSTVNLYSLNATMELRYLDSSNVYKNVPSAYDYGTDTGETSEGVAVAWSQSDQATLTTGPSLLYGMWNISSITQMQWYKGSITPSNSFVFVNPGSSYLPYSASWAPLGISGKYSFELPGQPYMVNVSLSGYAPIVTSLTSSMAISLARGDYGTYTPLYALSNSQIPSISYKGAGTVNDQYMLFNGSTSLASSIYSITNDFYYSVFYGMLIYNVSYYVTAQNQTLFTSGIGFGIGVPLPDVIMQSSNFTLLNSTFVVGSLDFPITGVSPAVNVFNSTNVFIGANYFAGPTIDLYIWNGTGNLVWGNEFFNNLSYFSFEGIELNSSGNLIYNNYFWGLDFDVFALNFNYNGTLTTNTWNIANQSASILHSFNGYELSGSIIGTSYQGGNYWWNYAGQALPFDDYGDIWEYNWNYHLIGGRQGDFVPLVANYVHFIENGLPSNLTLFYNVIFNSTFASSGSSEITLNVLNGTYPFTVPVVNEVNYSTFQTTAEFIPTLSSGTVTVSGKPVTEDVTFTGNYLVNFTETGLPAGTEWFVNLSTGSYHTTGSYMDIYLPNATYSYTIATTDKIYSAPGGTFTVDGQPQSVAVTFQEDVYSQEFTEQGLPSGTLWSVTVDQTQYASTSNSIYVKLPNGSYDAQFSSPSGYFPTPSQYMFTVDGYTGSFDIAYGQTSNETFIKPVETIFPAQQTVLPGSVVNTNSFGIFSSGFAFDNRTGLLFMPAFGGGNNGLYVYNTLTGKFLKPINDPGAYGAVYDPSTGYVYAISASGNLSEINPSTLEIVKNVSVLSANVGEGFLNQQGSYIYAYNLNTGNITQIDASSMVLTKTLAVGPANDISPLYTVLGGNAYFANETGDAMLILNLSTGAVKTVSLPAHYAPFSVIQYYGSELFIGGENYSYLIYNVSSSAITLGPQISGIASSVAYDGLSHTLYIASFSLGNTIVGNITEVNPANNGIITIIPSFITLEMTFDSSTQEIFADNYILGSVSVYSVQHYYTVTFTESGLPSGVEWYVNGTGFSDHASAPSNISFSLTNGTYVFTVTNLSSYYTTTYSFTVNVDGKNVIETVNYYHYAYITGTISPSNAALTINGKSVSLSSAGAFNVSVANGTYHVAASLSGYNSYYSNFTLNSGNVKNLTITLKPISTPSTISPLEIYAIIGAVVAIVAIIGVLMFVRRR